MEQALASTTAAINVDCRHVHAFDPDMYSKIVSFPQETIPLMDDALHQIKAQRYPNWAEMKFETRPFAMVVENRLRDLDPSDIDRLVSVKGMVTRTSHIIPDLRLAIFECSVCGSTAEAQVEHHRVIEPDVCLNANCQEKTSMRIAHNRSTFVDKQIIRLQVRLPTPCHMPLISVPHTHKQIIRLQVRPLTP